MCDLWMDLGADAAEASRNRAMVALRTAIVAMERYVLDDPRSAIARARPCEKCRTQLREKLIPHFRGRLASMVAPPEDQPDP